MFILRVKSVIMLDKDYDVENVYQQQTEICDHGIILFFFYNSSKTVI